LLKPITRLRALYKAVFIFLILSHIYLYAFDKYIAKKLLLVYVKKYQFVYEKNIFFKKYSFFKSALKKVKHNEFVVEKKKLEYKFYG